MPAKFNKTKEAAAAKLFRALGNPTRLWIVRQLAHQEYRVSDLVEAVGSEFATVSRHLARLKSHKIICSRRKGREIWYSINKNAVRMFLDLFKQED